MPLFFALLPSPSSVAAPLCIPQRSQITAQRAVAELGLKVGQVDEADRKTADEFGANNKMSGDTVEKLYAASGDMMCPNNGGQAQLAVKNDTIITSAHLFDVKMDCKKITPFKACRFITRVGGVNKEYKIKSVAGTGHKCPFPKKSGKTVAAPKEDWIVLKLEESVDPKVKAYQIPRDGKVPLVDDQKIVAVAKSEDWPIGSTKSLRDRPRHYGNCTARTTDVEANEGVIGTDCDSSHGSSGGGILTPGPDPTLLAIWRGSLDPEKNAKCDKVRYQFNVGPYDPSCWAGGAVAITDEMAKAITGDASTPALPSGPTNAPPIEGFKLPGIRM